MSKKVFISLTVLLLIAALLVGVVAYFTDGFVNWNFGGNHDGETPHGELCVLVNGGKYEDGTALSSAATIEVVGAEEVTAEVVPNNSSFDFRHNGSLVKFPYVDGNFNAAFGVVVEGNSVSVSGQRSVERVMQALYPDEEITDISEIDSEKAYFSLLLTSNGARVEIPLSGFYAWISVALDREEISF